MKAKTSLNIVSKNVKASYECLVVVKVIKEERKKEKREKLATEINRKYQYTIKKSLFSESILGKQLFRHTISLPINTNRK